jgi:hypothetical protein
MRNSATLLLLATLSACGGGDGGETPLVDAGRIDEVLSGYVARGELVGVSALVFEHDEEAYFGAFGFADRESGRAMQRDTLVQIYSMTKPLTGGRRPASPPPRLAPSTLAPTRIR